jgi:hypothetical protein
MPANYVLLEKITVGAAGASSVTFSGIPQTGYTDLVVKASVRSDKASAFADLTVKFNASTTSYTNRLIYGDGSTAGSYLNNYANQGYITTMNAASTTSSTFTSAEIYIPNYTSANNKSYSDDGVTENNGTDSYAVLNAGLWSNSAAITSIELLTPSGNFVANTTFYLYGVAKLGTTPAIVPYATGGDTIMTDGTYWYHAFRSSGTFTPAKGLSCDVLAVAGGGGAASYAGGGGGAGGLLTFTSQSLTATNYTVTIGAGGANSGTDIGTNIYGSDGINSQFGSLTACIGGGGGGGGSGFGTSLGRAGGSGGGGGGRSGTAYGGAGTSGQGYAGGDNNASGYNGGGGGGAGGAGATGSGIGGQGGIGATSALINAMGSATSTGQLVSTSYYFAGGGGGYGSPPSADGGYGGGGGSAVANGTANTGGGGGTSSAFAYGNGGSGIVIVRYAV